MKQFVLVAILFLLNSSNILAHPGNTASDGCHYCRTNCDKWGVAWNERHCHGGSTTPAIVVTATPAPTRMYTATPTESPTPTDTPTPTATPTKESRGEVSGMTKEKSRVGDGALTVLVTIGAVSYFLVKSKKV